MPWRNLTNLGGTPHYELKKIAAEGKSAATSNDAETASTNARKYSTFANPDFLCDTFQNDGMPC